MLIFLVNCLIFKLVLKKIRSKLVNIIGDLTFNNEQIDSIMKAIIDNIIPNKIIKNGSLKLFTSRTLYSKIDSLSLNSSIKFFISFLRVFNAILFVGTG